MIRVSFKQRVSGVFMHGVDLSSSLCESVVILQNPLTLQRAEVTIVCVITVKRRRVVDGSS